MWLLLVKMEKLCNWKFVFTIKYLFNYLKYNFSGLNGSIIFYATSSMSVILFSIDNIAGFFLSFLEHGKSKVRLDLLEKRSPDTTVTSMIKMVRYNLYAIIKFGHVKWSSQDWILNIEKSSIPYFYIW